MRCLHIYCCFTASVDRHFCTWKIIIIFFFLSISLRYFLHQTFCKQRSIWFSTAGGHGWSFLKIQINKSMPRNWKEITCTGQATNRWWWVIESDWTMRPFYVVYSSSDQFIENVFTLSISTVPYYAKSIPNTNTVIQYVNNMTFNNLMELLKKLLYYLLYLADV